MKDEIAAALYTELDDGSADGPDTVGLAEAVVTRLVSRGYGFVGRSDGTDHAF